MKPMLVRTAVAGGTTLLALGLAGPALACPWGGNGAAGTSFKGSSVADPSLTLAEYQAKVDAHLAKWLTKLADAKTRIADSTKLSDAEKTDKTARLDDLVATIEALRVQVAGETSIKAIKADIRAAFAPDVDDVKARIDDRLADWLTKIDAWEAKVAADDSLDPDAKAKKLAKLQAWEDKLIALRAEVAAETTLEGVKADLKAANLAILLGWGHRFGHHHKSHDGRHHDGRHSKHDGDRASDHRTSGHRTADVSFVWGRGDHGDRDGHRDGWGRGDRDRNGHHDRGGHDRSGHGDRGSFA